MGLLVFQPFQVGIVAVEILHLLVVELPTGIEIPAGQAEEEQGDDGADQKAEIAFDPVHTTSAPLRGA